MDLGEPKKKVSILSVFFLLKKAEDGSIKGIDSYKRDYKTTSVPFYVDYRFNSEHKYRVYRTELRMEFYIELLQSFTVSGDNVLSVYAGSKFLIACTVRVIHF